ncbi:MAG TPA: response regulator [Spirochaetes bacterium]|nr:response regulator [Spirochaetota bacterium]
MKEKISVLIAEDSRVQAQYMRDVLEQYNYHVCVTHDGEEAWDEFEKKIFPIVISDWEMPRMDGLELIRRIRSCRRSGYVYTLLVTAKGQKEDLIKGMEAGADDFLTKPFDSDELKVRLRAGERILSLEQILADQNRALKKANKRMSSDLEAAAKIQTALLPTVQKDIQGLNYTWFFKPCEELAGDLFNVFMLDRDKVGFYVLDVSGHGVPAALLSVTLNQLLSPNPDQSNLLVQRKGDYFSAFVESPGNVAEKLNKQFPIDSTAGRYFTLLYGILDLKSHDLRYVSAGHPGIIYLPVNAEPEMWRIPGLPIGFSDNGHYENCDFHLNEGDRLVLYSDCAVEMRDKKGEQFGNERMLEVFRKKGTTTLQQTLGSLVQALDEWSGKIQFEDDLTILVIEIQSS